MDNKDFLMIIESITELRDNLEKVLEKVTREPEPYQSRDVHEIYTALAEAHTQLPPLESNKVNPWFDSPYLDIFHLSRKLYPILGKYGLTIMQPKRISDAGSTILYTRLTHSSGQWIESRVRVIPPKNDIDSYRSTLNALRVSEILSLLGLGISHDMFDDDGEIAMNESRRTLSKSTPIKDLKTKKEDAETITKEQREELEIEMGEHTELGEEIMERCHVRSLADIPKSQFRNAITFVRKWVKVREGK